MGYLRDSDVLSVSRLALQWRKQNSTPFWFGIKRAESQETSCVAYMQCIPLDEDKLVGKNILSSLNSSCSVNDSFQLHASSSCSGQMTDNKKALHTLSSMADKYRGPIWNPSLSNSIFTRTFLRHQNINSRRTDVVRLLVLNFLGLCVETSFKFLEREGEYFRDDSKVYGSHGISYDTVNLHNEVSGQFETFVDAVQDIVDAVEFVISSIARSRTSSAGPVDATTIPAPVVAMDIQHAFEDIRSRCMERVRGYHERC